MKRNVSAVKEQIAGILFLTFVVKQMLYSFAANNLFYQARSRFLIK
jgi:hypothetical protein